MFKKIKNIIMAAILPFAVRAPMVLAPVTVHAAVTTEIGACNGTSTSASDNIGGSLNQGINSASANNTGCDLATGSGPSDLQSIARKVVNFLSVIVGVIAVIMIIVGGFRYITSGGDSNRVGGAKNTLIYAIVGLIIVALAQFIVRFVLTNVTTQ